MYQKNNIVMVFTEETSSALLDIEKKYNLEESDEEWMKKLNEKKPFNKNIIINLIREFAKTNIQEKEFIASLEKNLSIDNKTAEEIFKYIAVNIMPFLIKTTEEEIKKGAIRDTNNVNKKTQPIILKPLRTIREVKSINNTNDVDKIKIQENIAEIKSPTVKANIDEKIDKKSIIRKKIEEIKKPIKKDDVKKQTDSYREPIE